MAFRELQEGLQKTLPRGASERYARLTALEKMLSGELYEHLPWSFETEKVPGKSYVSIRERRPSVDFNLAYEITQDTLAELFGDEQFPTLKVAVGGKQDEDASTALAEIVGPFGLNLPAVMAEAYEEGVVGAVGIIVHANADGLPYYEILPAKWCEPVYAEHSQRLIALVVTYPIDDEMAEEKFPGITTEPENVGAKTFWYRFIVGPLAMLHYRPMPDDRYARLGEEDERGKKIEFVEHLREPHRFAPRTPALYVKNPGGKQREPDGPALWWPIRNACVEIDYTLSQAGRGLRYSADPMLFIKKSGLVGDFAAVEPAGYENQQAASAAQTQKANDGSAVRGATQTIVGEDAKLLEISANGITEEREYVRDLREYALEVVGGMKARAEHLKGAASGTAIDKGLKPLRRLVRRLRVPYGIGLLLGLIDLTLYGIRGGILDLHALGLDVDADDVPENARITLEWPNDETLKGQELFYHVQALELAAGGSVQQPIELVAREAMGQKIVADLGLHGPFDAIKGDLQTAAERNPPDPSPGIVKP